MPAEIPDGAVLIARAILRSPIWRMRPEDCKVAITLIALVNHAPGRWFDGFGHVNIEKGQLIRSREKLAEDCKLSIQVLRSCLKRLEAELDQDGIPFLTRKSTSRYTLYTLPKYPFYQDLRNYGGKANQALVKSDELTSAPPQINQRKRQNQPAVNLPSRPSDPPSKPESLKSPPPTQPAPSGESPSKKRLPNHKQEQQQQQLKQEQTRPLVDDASPGPAPPLEDDRPGGGTSVEPAPPRTPLPLLDQVNFRRGVLLLLSVGIGEETARGLAVDRPIGEIVDVVQAARRASNPGGYAVDAIRKGWGVPRAEAARVEIFGQLEADHAKAEALLMTRPPKYPQLPGETADEWLHRVNDLRKAEKLKQEATK